MFALKAMESLRCTSSAFPLQAVHTSISSAYNRTLQAKQISLERTHPSFSPDASIHYVYNLGQVLRFCIKWTLLLLGGLKEIVYLSNLARCLVHRSSDVKSAFASSEFLTNIFKVAVLSHVSYRVKTAEGAPN